MDFVEIFISICRAYAGLLQSMYVCMYVRRIADRMLIASYLHKLLHCEAGMSLKPY